MNDQWNEWTPCQWNGHLFDEDDRCECGERREED